MSKADLAWVDRIRVKASRALRKKAEIAEAQAKRVAVPLPESKPPEPTNGNNNPDKQ